MPDRAALVRRSSGSYVYVVVPFVGSPGIWLFSVSTWPARLNVRVRLARLVGPAAVADRIVSRPASS
jgi:hypothetical protein